MPLGITLGHTFFLITRIDMKKILVLASTALLLASCGSNEYEEWAKPQSNAEETANSVKFTVAEAPAIDFNTVTADSFCSLLHQWFQLMPLLNRP